MATLSPVEQLDRAIEVALSHLQVNWSQADKVRIAQALSGLPPLYQGYPMPFSTYLLFVLEQGHLNRLCYVNALIHDTILQKFSDGYAEMQADANTTAIVDQKNFQSEACAFQDIAKAISSPHLAISTLYRYMVAIQMSLDSLITDDLFTEAKLQLRKNPYSYFAYGPKFVPFLPLRWRDL